MRLLIISALVVMLTHLLEGIAGFGGAVMALPFLNLTLGLNNSVHLLCLFGWLMAFYIVLRSWRQINWKELGFISIFAGTGMPLGLFLFEYLPGIQLCILLGIFMGIVGIHGFMCQFKKAAAANVALEKNRNIWMKILLFIGGIFQGAFGCGGPCIVIYSAKSMPDKGSFRATLSLLWLLLNSCRLGVWSFNNSFWNLELLKMFAVILPFMFGGLVLGDLLHHKVNEKHFTIGVYSLLTISGIIMVFNNAAALFGQR